MCVPFNRNFGIERVTFLGTGSSSANGLSNTCKASVTEVAFLLMLYKRARHTLIILLEKQSPRPYDAAGTSTAISFLGTKGIEGFKYSGSITLGYVFIIVIASSTDLGSA